jgi:hypothetical protein
MKREYNIFSNLVHRKFYIRYRSYVNLLSTQKLL